MLIEIILILSVVLKLFAALYTFRILRLMKAQASWVIIAVSLLVLGMISVLEIMEIKTGRSLPIKYGFTFFVSVLLMIGIVLIGKVLSRMKLSEASSNLFEQRYNILFNNSSDEILVSDFEGNIVEANKAACEVLGYTKTELLTMHMTDIRSAKYVMDLYRNIDKVKKEKRHRFESEHLNKAGEVIPVEVKSQKVVFNDQPFISWVARDISERKEMENKILSVVIQTEERERERFSKDLHDGLAPLLSTIKLYVNELATEGISKEEREEYIQYSNELIDDAISNTRTISNDLTPHVISKYGLVKAIGSFIKKINATHKIEVVFKTLNIDTPVDHNIELIIFRITTELINNTVKHAGADQVHIILEVINNKLILSYRDNGVGFDVDEALERSPEGIGLKNIVSRVHSVNGTCNFYNHESRGTNIKIKVDLGQEDA